ncbi:hypothetical protein SEEN2570_06953, partial [Salmonella enterica subsp. enterica serovar Newport str. VA_R100512570]
MFLPEQLLEAQDPDRNCEAIFNEQGTKLVGQSRSLLNHLVDT